MKLKILWLGLFLCLLLPFPRLGHTINTHTSPQTILDQDAVFFGSQVTLEGIVNGNVLIVGDQVQVNGTVNGSLVLIGQNVFLNGQVSGSTYALALSLELDERASLERDLYVATVSLTSANGSRIGRDLFALGLDAGLNGQVGRALHTILGPIQLYNALMRLLGLEEFTIRLRIETSTAPPYVHGWQLAAAEPGLGLGLFPLGFWNTATPFDWNSWLLARLRLWLTLAAFALLMLWLLQPTLEASSQRVRLNPWRTLGTGMLILLAILNAFVLLIALYALFFALGLGLVYLGIWQIAVALWILTFCALLALIVALWLFVLYGAKVIACYVLLPRLFSRAGIPARFGWLALAMFGGTLVYTLLRGIPYLGALLDILVTALGAGALWMAWRHRKRTARPRRRKERTIETIAVQ